MATIQFRICDKNNNMKMGNDKINETIFRSLGWSTVEDSPYKSCNWNKGAAYTAKPPNYANSLDACAEFERTIKTERDRNSYVSKLKSIYNTFAELGDIDTYFLLATATPLQRCVAYLRVKGLSNE